MLKSDELQNPTSCLNKALPNERLFILLARDPAAPITIRAWITERLRLGKNKEDDAQVQEALECASCMEDERAKMTQERAWKAVRTYTEQFRQENTPSKLGICRTAAIPFVIEDLRSKEIEATRASTVAESRDVLVGTYQNILKSIGRLAVELIENEVDLMTTLPESVSDQARRGRLQTVQLFCISQIKAAIELRGLIEALHDPNCECP